MLPPTPPLCTKVRRPPPETPTTFMFRPYTTRAMSFEDTLNIIPDADLVEPFVVERVRTGGGDGIPCPSRWRPAGPGGRIVVVKGT